MTKVGSSEVFFGNFTVDACLYMNVYEWVQITECKETFEVFLRIFCMDEILIAAEDC